MLATIMVESYALDKVLEDPAMARIPDADIERMKAEVSLVRLVEASGVTLEKRGADHVGRCPFHDDKTPSLVVTPAKNLWRCFGACDAGGDVIA